MKAILYNSNQDSWELSSLEKPILSNGEVLVKVSYAGLCGSDMHRINSPSLIQEKVPLGHEIVGSLVSADGTLTNECVVINPIITCNSCDKCKNGCSQFCDNIRSIGKTISGGFAEFVVAPKQNIYVFPDHLDKKLGVLVDGTAVALHAYNSLKNLKSNRLLVIGDGTVAATLIAVGKVKYPDAEISVIGKHENNIAFLKSKYGVSVLTEQEKDFDACFETVGRDQAQTLNIAIKKLKPGGEIVVLGVYPENYDLPLQARAAFYKELSIKGSNSFVSGAKLDEFSEAINLISKHPSLFDGIVTHEIPLENFNQGIEVFRKKSTSGAIKVAFTI